MELANVVTFLPKAMSQNVLGEVCPTLFIVLDFSVVTTAKAIKLSSLLLQGRVSCVRGPIGRFWRWRFCATRHCSSPDADAVRWREVKFFSGLDVEGIVPGVDIPHGVCAVFCGGVRVSQDLLAK